LSEAQTQARQGAAKLAEQFATRGQLERYGYADRPLREPVLREIRDSGGEISAVVTRNSYGCHVLNTARAMFVDVDLPEGVENLAAVSIAKADAWARQQAGWSWRVYRTQAGLRLLATHQLFHPEDAICQAVFNATGCDPLYKKLCQTQSCFRARLTPKPWRCELPNPPSRWPFEDTGAERQYAQWDARYQSVCAGRATCQFVSTVGSGEVHEAIQPLIALHDDISGVNSGLPLA
jgi:hypothetical protein